MGHTSEFIFLMGIVLATGIFFSPSQGDAGGENREPFQELLGYRIECIDARGSRCQVIDSTSTPEHTLYEGSRESSEQYLLDLLKEKYGDGYPNLPTWTLGGRQFWGDVFVHAGWRIQHNVLTDHYRLLDPDDVRQAWGSYEATRTYYEQPRRERGIQHAHRHAVVLVHGIFRSRHSLGPIKTALLNHQFQPVGVNYPSTRQSLEDHADQLNTVLNRLPEADTVSFVTHSMGGLVVRQALAREPAWRSRLKLGRIVMLAPPNQGSQVADQFEDFLPYRVLTGPTGSDLTTEAVKNLPEPQAEIGIIAGELQGPGFFGFWLEGTSDGTVETNSTRLDKMSDFTTVEGMHSFLMNQPEAIEQAIIFLETGKFTPDGDSSN